MTNPRYVIALRVSDLVHMATPVLALPDAEHVHVTRHPDGTITAVPMRPLHPHDLTCDTWVDIKEPA